MIKKNKQHSKLWSHELSYRAPNIAAVIHRSRLNKILSLFHNLELPEKGYLADFGCSNGYIISLLKERIFKSKKWQFYGFDFWKQLLEDARNRQLSNTEFHYFNLNIINTEWKNKFDIVTCLETIEHMGNYKNAFVNLYNSCKVGGKIICSAPNEIGGPGLIKYLGRKVLRKNSYENFFKEKKEQEYLYALIFNREIESFRNPPRDEWAAHLGFDWRIFERLLNEDYLKDKCVLLKKATSFFNFNFIYVLEKRR